MLFSVAALSAPPDGPVRESREWARLNVMKVPVRPEWDGTARNIAELFDLRKGLTRRFRAVVVTHPQGTELRIIANGEIVMTQVFEDDQKLMHVVAGLKSRLQSSGWFDADRALWSPHDP